MTQRKDFILKVLILLGLIAIFVSLYIQYGIPYQEEVERQKNDERRIADLDVLNSQIAQLLAASSTAKIGDPQTVYLSLASNNADCSPFELPSLPDGWQYRCAPGNTYTNPDGSGWIPVALPFAELPIDPLNTPETLNYYAYVATTTIATSSAATVTTNQVQATKQFVLTTVLDSKKHLTEAAQEDLGSDPIRYEVGTGIFLWNNVERIVSCWPLDDGFGQTVGDITGNYPGDLSSNLAWKLNEDGQALLDFDGSGYVRITNASTSPEAMTVTLRVRPTRTAGRILGNYNDDLSGGWRIYYLPGGNFVFGVSDGEKDHDLVSSGTYSPNMWHSLAASYDKRKGVLSVTVNDDRSVENEYFQGVITSSNDLEIGSYLASGRTIFSGNINKVCLFNRALDDRESTSYISL